MENEKSHGYANETTSSKSGEQLIESQPIEDTPFTAVRYEEKWFLTLGKYRLTDTLNSLEQVKEEARDASWWRIMQIVQIMIDEDRAKRAEEFLRGQDVTKQ